MPLKNLEELFRNIIKTNLLISISKNGTTKTGYIHNESLEYSNDSILLFDKPNNLHLTSFKVERIQIHNAEIKLADVNSSVNI